MSLRFVLPTASLALPLLCAVVGVAQPPKSVVTGDPARIERIRKATLPKIDKPVMFDTHSCRGSCWSAGQPGKSRAVVPVTIESADGTWALVRRRTRRFQRECQAGLAVSTTSASRGFVQSICARMVALPAPL